MSQRVHGVYRLLIGLLTTVWFIGLLPTSSVADAPAQPVTNAASHPYFSWDSWIGAIGLPDDCFKSVVDADGAFWTELRPGHDRYGVYPNAPPQSVVMIQADLSGGAKRLDQQMLDPRTPICVARKQQGRVAVRETLFFARPLDWSADVKGAALKDRNTTPRPRQYLLMVEYTNQGDQQTEVSPVLRLIGATLSVDLADTGAFRLAANTRCRLSRKIESFGNTSDGQFRADLGKIALAPGEKARWLLAIDRNGYKSDRAVEWDEAEQLLKQASAYWKNSTGLPYGVIDVPDRDVQALLDASIRELYQMRYVINGLPAFFFGPWCYNDYWVLDGSFVTEAMEMLGRGDDSDGYVEYLMLHQRKDGRFQCIPNFWKETGIAVYTMYRHARMRQDRQWLQSRWPQFSKAVEAIKGFRAMSNDPKSLNYRLSPIGFGDGGIGHEAEYTNNYWLLAGMNAAVDAAKWLGKNDDAAAWEKEYRDYQNVFQKAIARDAKVDSHGNRYIPVVMGPKPPEHPTRGQWAFCQAVYPGCIFAKDDPLMLGTLKMLASREIQGGIVEDSGWIGVWPQCGSFYGHDWLWLGDGQKAAKLLYAFARHASPVWNWREEMPKQTKPGEQFPYSKQVGGDMPHVSAAAEFIRLTAHLLAFDRGQELHLLEGLPTAWLKPGMTTRVNGLGTPFGPLHMELSVAQDGKTATLHVGPLSDPQCQRIVVHVGGWAATDPTAVRVLEPGKKHELSLQLVDAAPNGS
jgi:hypothetical protein